MTWKLGDEDGARALLLKAIEMGKNKENEIAEDALLSMVNLDFFFE